MTVLSSQQRDQLERLCEAHGVVRLELFGSAVRADFDPGRSDLDFLVTFSQDCRNDVDGFLSFEAALSELFGRPVDLVEREAVEQSRNPIRKRLILSEAEPVYG